MSTTANSPLDSLRTVRSSTDITQMKGIEMKRLIRLAMLGVSAFATCAAGADGAAVVAYWPFGTNGLMDVSGEQRWCVVL